MSVLKVILLGALQGVTEFLPVSSSGHLVLLETLFGFRSESPEMLLFDLAVHLGTVVAVVVVFWRVRPGFRTREMMAPDVLAGSAEALKPLSWPRLLAMILAATIATGILVMPIKAKFEQGGIEVAVLSGDATDHALEMHNPAVERLERQVAKLAHAIAEGIA